MAERDRLGQVGERQHRLLLTGYGFERGQGAACLRSGDNQHGTPPVWVAAQPAGEQRRDRFGRGAAGAVEVGQRIGELFVVQAGEAVVEQVSVAAEDVWS